jgi:hypothetical protein
MKRDAQPVMAEFSQLNDTLISLEAELGKPFSKPFNIFAKKQIRTISDDELLVEVVNHTQEQLETFEKAHLNEADLIARKKAYLLERQAGLEARRAELKYRTTYTDEEAQHKAWALDIVDSWLGRINTDLLTVEWMED